jgi:hypothetical protein
MGTPAYKTEPSSLRRAVGEAVRDTFTMAASANQWTPVNVIDTASSRWPSTTLNTFSTLQEMYPVPIGSTVWAKIRVSSGLAGSEVRVISDDGVTVIYGASVFASGIQELQMTLPTVSITSGIWLQARSLTAGQTTSLIILSALGR